MLVLSRKLNESIRINDEIEVTILEVCGKRVRLGINAPRHIGIRRVDPAQEPKLAFAEERGSGQLAVAGR
jgi:carbon storage regulator CsrA